MRVGLLEATTRLSRTDLLPALAIIGEGSVGVGASDALFFTPHHDAVAVEVVSATSPASQIATRIATRTGTLAVADVCRFEPALNRDQPRPLWVSFPVTFQVR